MDNIIRKILQEEFDRTEITKEEYEIEVWDTFKNYVVPAFKQAGLYVVTSHEDDNYIFYKVGNDGTDRETPIIEIRKKHLYEQPPKHIAEDTVEYVKRHKGHYIY